MSEELQDLLIIGQTKDESILSKNQCKELVEYLINIDNQNKVLQERLDRSKKSWKCTRISKKRLFFYLMKECNLSYQKVRSIEEEYDV